MPLRDLFNLRLRQSGEIRCLGGDNSSKLFWTMRFEIFSKEPGGAAFPRPMANKDDRIGANKVRGDLLVVGVFLGSMFAFVVSFITVDQMVLEPKGIIWFNSGFVCGPAAAEIAINVSNVMVDDHDHSSGLVWAGGHPKVASFVEKMPQSRYLLDPEVVGAGALEESSPGADHEGELVVSVWLDLADFPNQVYN